MRSGGWWRLQVMGRRLGQEGMRALGPCIAPRRCALPDAVPCSRQIQSTVSDAQRETARDESMRRSLSRRRRRRRRRGRRRPAMVQSARSLIRHWQEEVGMKARERRKGSARQDSWRCGVVQCKLGRGVWSRAIEHETCVVTSHWGQREEELRLCHSWLAHGP